MTATLMGPNKVFIDTNIFVALKDKNDSTHQKAVTFLSVIEEKKISLVTSSDIIGETLTVMTMKLGRAHATDFLSGFVTSGIEEIFVDEDMHAQARKLFIKVASKNFSFIDCSSAVVMGREHISTIFTFDRDFKKFDITLFEE